MVALSEVGDNGLPPGRFYLFRGGGGDIYFFGHTMDQAMENLRTSLKRRRLPFIEIDETALPQVYREALVFLRQQA